MPHNRARDAVGSEKGLDRSFDDSTTHQRARTIVNDDQVGLLRQSVQTAGHRLLA